MARTKGELQQEIQLLRKRLKDMQQLLREAQEMHLLRKRLQEMWQLRRRARVNVENLRDVYGAIEATNAALQKDFRKSDLPPN
jgi:predicted  nucleic acid-binding Zn-ribbon protein